jgi:hypothetical protein
VEQTTLTTDRIRSLAQKQGAVNGQKVVLGYLPEKENLSRAAAAL